MTDYLVPGLYVEEKPLQSPAIVGASTSAAGFVGPARFGPVGLVPDVMTSLGEFERIYGKGKRLEFADRGESHNYLWHATRAFFEEGGKRLYVGRVFRSLAGAGASGSEGAPTTFQRPSENISDADSNRVGELYADGHARVWLTSDPPGQEAGKSVLIRARWPGVAGNVVVTVAVKLHENLLAGETGKLTAAGLSEYDTVWLSHAAGAAHTSLSGSLYRALYDKREQTWLFGNETTSTSDDLRLNTPLSSGVKSVTRTEGDNTCQLRVVTLTVSVTAEDGGTYVWDRIAPDAHHTGTHGADSLGESFAQNPSSPIKVRVLPIVVLIGAGIGTGVELVQTLLGGAGSGEPADTSRFDKLDWLDDDSVNILRAVELEGGNDGRAPGVSEYIGETEKQFTSGLASLEPVEDVSIVAVPGATANYKNNTDEANAIVAGLVAHAERMRYRIALVDSGDKQSMPEVRATRALIDSTYAAFYYPWVRVLDPITDTEINLPPSGFVAGIYARTDAERGVAKAPADEVVRGAIGLEVTLNKEQQDILNAAGINCLRFFAGRGSRLWGARTASSNPEWKYVNVRRYFAYLEHSIENGTLWTVFEPNNEMLWANVRSVIEDFLHREWISGALQGKKPEEAYFVKCDRTTMTQEDLDSGHLVCMVGVAPLKPAEFVIFRIGQWSGGRKDP